MLYQLSYASPIKPSKNIKEAIELQGAFLARQTRCQHCTYLLFSFFYGTLWTCRLRKNRVLDRHILPNFLELDRISRVRALLLDLKRQLDSIHLAII